MGERRVMELLLQFIMGGGSIVGQSEAQHHSCSSKGGRGGGAGSAGWGTPPSYVLLPHKLRLPAAAPQQGTPLGMETRGLPMTQALVSHNSQAPACWKMKESKASVTAAWLVTTAFSLLSLQVAFGQNPGLAWQGILLGILMDPNAHSWFSS